MWYIFVDRRIWLIFFVSSNEHKSKKDKYLKLEIPDKHRHQCIGIISIALNTYRIPKIMVYNSNVSIGMTVLKI